MGLRLRLAVLLVVAVVPFAFALATLQGAFLRQSAARATGDAIAARLDGVAHERCEAAPEDWPMGDRFRRRRAPRRGPPRTPPLFAFDASLRAARPDAPPLPPSVRDALAAGEELAWSSVEHGPRPHLLVARRVADEGRCAVVVALVPNEERALWLTLLPALAVSLFAVLLVVFAAGPLVRRVRRLTAAVGRAREGEDVVIPIEGRDELTALARALAEDRAALAGKVAELKRRDEALTTFVANTTHDVMIPLTVLQNHLLSIRQRSPDGSTEEELASHALSEAHYLGSLLQNLSAAAKLDAAPGAEGMGIERIEFDLADLVGRVATRHRTLAKQKGIAIEHATPERLMIEADLTLVERALSNLVHNAIRYGEAGGHVAVVLEPRDDGGFTLEVLDDGPGVSAEDLPRLGERRFRSADARTRQPSGTGLGLAIAREVAERHGWTLRFEAGEPRGLRAILESTAPLGG
ncbi:MAG: HAMP domain-containing histidine kinase [Myxococcales bacterium]|nr:HAMP domain-containing histidine kinase [Myxococcales bacterium]